MKLTVNGKLEGLAEEMSIAEFLRSKAVREELVIVEHNLRVAERAEWPTTVLRENDRLEVVQLLGGG